MKESRKYSINIAGLENKTYLYDFEGGKAFFEEFGTDVVEDGTFLVRVTLQKSEVMIQVQLHIEGKVSLICDRSLELFEEPFLVEAKYIYKFGEKAEVLSDEMEVISFVTDSINLSEHIYDFIHLSIPMKRLHPKFRNEDQEGEFTLIYTDVQDEEPEDATPDPRWEALKKIQLS